MKKMTISFKKVYYAFSHCQHIAQRMNLNYAEYMLWTKLLTLPTKESTADIKFTDEDLEFLKQVDSLTMKDFEHLIAEELDGE